MGEGRYRSLLCLVQVAVPDPERPGEVRVEVLDPLDDRLDPAPLAEVLADPEVEIVLHAGRQDVALLRRAWGTEVRGVFDTQVAAGFAGLPAQACCPTPRSSRWPSASRARRASSSRSAGSTPATCAAAARTSSTPWPAGASASRCPTRASATRRPPAATRR